MLDVAIKYNPYKVVSTITVNGETPKQNSKLIDSSAMESLSDLRKANTILVRFLAMNRLDNPDLPSIEQIEWAIQKCSCNMRVKAVLFAAINTYKQSRKLDLWRPEKFSKQAAIIRDLLGLGDTIDCARNIAIDFNTLNCYLNSIVSQRVDVISDDFLLSINHCLMKAYSDTADDGLEYYKFWHDAITERGKLM